jgi:hypothetical protein
MRKVATSDVVQNKLAELGLFLTKEYGMSRIAADARVVRIHKFLATLANPGDYALCRFRRWRVLGYHCVSFEGWVFAYETFDEGVIIRDMSHGKLLVDTVD